VFPEQFDMFDVLDLLEIKYTHLLSPIARVRIVTEGDFILSKTNK